MICNYPFPEYEVDAACELVKGHKGRHKLVLRWDTAPYDICKDKGHELGEWKLEDRGDKWYWRAMPPTHYRECTRCRKVLDTRGKKYE